MGGNTVSSGEGAASSVRRLEVLGREGIDFVLSHRTNRPLSRTASEPTTDTRVICLLCHNDTWKIRYD